MKEKTLNGKTYKLPGNLSAFQEAMYIHLINWKWKNITKESGVHKYNGENIQYDAILPESVRQTYPIFHPSIKEDFKKHNSKFDFKFHKHFNHIVSSQAANINLFLPILLHPSANTILQAIKPDLKEIATDQLYKGFRIEFWDGNSNKEKGILGDHSAIAGTDSDIGIAYYNHKDELCLWLIEHKLTEREFTACGGAKSKGRKPEHDCTKPFSQILEHKDLCYYHSGSNYEYWNITEKYQSFFENHTLYQSCPFKGGMNQLWRNQLLAFAMEDTGKYKEVYFSVVHHPKNKALNKSINQYKKLTENNPKFSAFTSREVIDSAHRINQAQLNDWIGWYRELYDV